VCSTASGADCNTFLDANQDASFAQDPYAGSPSLTFVGRQGEFDPLRLHAAQMVDTICEAHSLPGLGTRSQQCLMNGKASRIMRENPFPLAPGHTLTLESCRVAKGSVGIVVTVPPTYGSATICALRGDLLNELKDSAPELVPHILIYPEALAMAVGMVVQGLPDGVTAVADIGARCCRAVFTDSHVRRMGLKEMMQHDACRMSSCVCLCDWPGRQEYLDASTGQP
jgi:hypothetical protein